MRRLVLFVAVALISFVVPCMAWGLSSVPAPTMSVLHSFTGSPTDGESPYSNMLVASGSTVYGVTMFGGSNDTGVAFKVNTDASGYTILHHFIESSTDGADPTGGPILDGTTLYGTASYGGTYGAGNVFKLNTNGSGFSLIHSFDYTGCSGPSNSLALSGTTLYGTAGGSGGALFKVDTNGTGFDYVKPFTSSNYQTMGSLTVGTGGVYGTTYRGTGGSVLGSVFRVNPDLSGFSVIHSFTGAANDGAGPNGKLTLVGSTLYGLTCKGGEYGGGTLFKVNTNGTGFSILHSFEEYDNPWGDMTLVGSTLYGIARGRHNFGSIFSFDTDSADYNDLYFFESNGPAGIYPDGTLVVSGDKLCGMTWSQGQYNCGTVYALTVPGLAAPEPSTIVLLGIGFLSSIVFGRRRRNM